MAHAAANFSAVVEAFGQLYGYVSLMSFCTKTKGVKKENMLRALRNLTHHDPPYHLVPFGCWETFMFPSDFA